MTIRELYEMASLDALGLLDHEERRDFEQSLAGATPEVQSQIRREQLRFAQQEDFLPNVEAPAGLRAKVIQAVRDAISAVQHEPVGSIGGVNAANARLLNQAPFWRAACIAFATACGVLSYFMVEVHQQSQEIASMIEANEFHEQIAGTLGPRLTNVLFADQMQRLSFIPTAPDADTLRPQAQMFFDIENGTGHIILRNLPEPQGEYAVQFLDAEGKPIVTEYFINTGGLIPVPVKHVEGMSINRCRIRAPRGIGGEERVILETADM